MSLGKGNGFQSVPSPVTKESVKFNQEEMVAQYRKQAEALRAQIVDLQKELDNLNETFKAQYAERLEKLVSDEQAIQKYLEHNDQIARDFNATQAEFLQEKEDFAKEQEQIRTETQELIKHNKGLLDELDAKKLQDEETLRKNEDVLKENAQVIGQITSQQKALEVLTQKKADVNLLNAKVKEAEDLRDLYQNKIKDIESSKLELHLEEGKIDDKINTNRKLAEQTRQEIKSLNDKKEEINALIKMNQDILNQILAERDANNQTLTALKAKERLLNEKDISLKEREKNVKIVEGEQ